MKSEEERIPQVPSPDEGDPPRSTRDPHHPTETAPDSVGESVYREAEHAGKSGPDAADDPEAAGKSDGAHDPDADHDSTG